MRANFYQKKRKTLNLLQEDFFRVYFICSGCIAFQQLIFSCGRQKGFAPIVRSLLVPITMGITFFLHKIIFVEENPQKGSRVNVMDGHLFNFFHYHNDN